MATIFNENIGVGTSSNISEKITLANTGYLGGVNAAGTAAVQIIGLNGSDQIQIGTSSTIFRFGDASAQLQIQGSTGHFFTNGTIENPAFRAYSNFAGIYFPNNGADIGFVYNAGGSEAMRITSSANVGIGTTSPGSKLHVNGGVQVGSPTGGDKGTGTINVSGDIYKNGTAYTNPDYVFAQRFLGRNDEGYAGAIPIGQLEDELRTTQQLPRIGREPMGVFARQDVLLEKLEEAYLYILELHKRVEALEAGREQNAGERSR